MNLDLTIYYEYFDINSTEKSIAVYKEINDKNIIFCHTQSSNKKVSLPENIKTYINDNKYIGNMECIHILMLSLLLYYPLHS